MGRTLKLRVEITPEGDSAPDPGVVEVILRSRERDETVLRAERVLADLLRADTELILTLGDTEYYVPTRELLFFETLDGKVAAHTAKNQYYTHRRLFELEAMLGPGFLRVSKSCVLNLNAVCALSHNLAGGGRVQFRGTDKAVYVSRSYFKLLKERLYELRFHDRGTPPEPSESSSSQGGTKP